jgi:hypothetical protein
MASTADSMAATVSSVVSAIRPPTSGGPSRQQVRFLVFIREYVIRNESGVAPSPADFLWLFVLTPLLVDVMLIRL